MKSYFYPSSLFFQPHASKGKKVNTYYLKANNLIITNSGQFLKTKVKNRPFT